MDYGQSSRGSQSNIPPSPPQIPGLGASNIPPGFNIFSISGNQAPTRNSPTTNVGGPSSPLRKITSIDNVRNILCRQPDNILREIFLLCGREASYLLRSTCKHLYHTRSAVSLEGQYYEPFTYADWKGLTQQQWQTGTDRRALLGLNRRPGQKQRGRQRWMDFKAAISKCDESRWSVRRIAVSHWMLLDDFRWIAKELPALEALDLSDLSDYVWYPEDTDDEYITPEDGYGFKSKKHSMSYKRERIIDDSYPPYWDEIERAIVDAGTWPVKLSEDDLSLLPELTDAEKARYRAEADPLYADVHNWVRDKARAETAGALLTSLSMKVLAQESSWDNQEPPIKAKVARVREAWKSDGQYQAPQKEGTYGLDDSITTEEPPDDSRLRALFRRKGPPPLFKRLKWLSLRNWADMRYHQLECYKSEPGQPWDDYTLRKSDMLRPTYGSWTFLSKCENLETLSIRGFYEPDDQKTTPSQVHWNICAFIDCLVENVSPTVSRLELRQSMEWLSLLLEHIVSTTNITKVGIDLGAWLQTYPLDAYSKYELEKPRPLNISAQVIAASVHNEINMEELRCERKHEAIVERNDFDRAKTAAQCLGRITRAFELWLAIRAFPLSPEIPDTREVDAQPLHYKNILWPNPSCTSVLSPLTLVEWFDAARRPVRMSEWGTKAQDMSATDFRPTFRLPIIFRWLHDNLDWQPIFDWTPLIEHTLPTHDPSPDLPTPAVPTPQQLASIKAYFDMLRDASIPLHLLLGNRPDHASTLYWGSPFLPTPWQTWLTTPFNLHLKPIAPLIQTLSIFYALADPLSTPTLSTIAARDPLLDTIPPSTLARRASPPGTSQQIMANKAPLAPPRHLRRSPYPVLHARNCPLAPPPGAIPFPLPHTKLAGGPDAAFPDTDPHDPHSLHALARAAAYEREALGWQRFWRAYALEFGALRALRIRMPKSFDNVSSWRLARLLEREVGWGMLLYFDERVWAADSTHPPLKGRGAQPVRTRPGLTFVRRSWVWDLSWLRGEKGKRRVRGVEFGVRGFGQGDWDVTEAEEVKEERKAQNRADNARRAEVGWLSPAERAARVRAQLARTTTAEVPLGRFGPVRASYVHGAEGVDADLDDPNGRRNTVTIDGIAFEATESQDTSHDETTDTESEPRPPQTHQRVTRLAPRESVQLGPQEDPLGLMDELERPEVSDMVVQTESGVRLFFSANPRGPASTAQADPRERHRRTEETNRITAEAARIEREVREKAEEERLQKILEEKRREFHEARRREEERLAAEKVRQAAEAQAAEERRQKEEEEAAWREAEWAREHMEQMKAEEAENRRIAAQLAEQNAEAARQARLAAEKAKADRELRAAQEAQEDEEQRAIEEEERMHAEEERLQQIREAEISWRRREEEERIRNEERRAREEEEARLEEDRIVRESKEAFEQFVEEHRDRGEDVRQGFLTRWAVSLEKWLASKQTKTVYVLIESEEQPLEHQPQQPPAPQASLSSHDSSSSTGTSTPQEPSPTRQSPSNHHSPPASPQLPVSEMETKDIVQEANQAEENITAEEVEVIRRTSEEITPRSRRRSSNLTKLVQKTQEAEEKLEKAKSELEQIKLRNPVHNTTAAKATDTTEQVTHTADQVKATVKEVKTAAELAEEAAERLREEQALMVYRVRAIVANDQVATATNEDERRKFEGFARKEARGLKWVHEIIREKRRRSSEIRRLFGPPLEEEESVIDLLEIPPMKKEIENESALQKKTEPSESIYDKQTVKELRALMKERQIPQTGLSRKAQIVEALKEADMAADAEGGVKANQGVKRTHEDNLQEEEEAQPKATKARALPATAKRRKKAKTEDAEYTPEPEARRPPRRSARIRESSVKAED
ncbi:hypothetical protein BU16DRAFT_580190 [Lophium mytilinum]|uniref:SAP domain-containing protein n=1 Tax=Lophium mytilinum TaxID=390894 RepID=A0A6A6QYK7_9PEZI|nr:hypothetical protein BU16DRAFT_580190 [Lophium mytilinum]